MRGDRAHRAHPGQQAPARTRSPGPAGEVRVVHYLAEEAATWKLADAELN